jgi:hypothetical protein
MDYESQKVTFRVSASEPDDIIIVKSVTPLELIYIIIAVMSVVSIGIIIFFIQYCCKSCRKKKQKTV